MPEGEEDAGSSLNVTLPDGDGDRGQGEPSTQPTLGRYQLHRLLGSGGMGAVFAAFDPELRRVVAVKVLHPVVAQAAAEMRREGQVMARLTHPNVVPVYDVGEAGGTTFVAMAYVKGGTLADWLAAAPRSPDEIIRVFRQAGRGLAAAHEAGLVHRDFKPGNVLVADDGHVMVSDFGLALPTNAPGTPAIAEVPAPLRAVFDSIKVSSSAVGTPAYMSPEQRLGRPLDARADQFSFCVALWYALYRQAPYAGKTGRDLLDAALAGKVVATPGTVRVPPPVRAALLRGLRADPDARFPTMPALLAALDAEAWQGRRRRLFAGLAVAVILAASFTLAWWWRGQANQVPPCDSLGPRFAAAWDASGQARTAFLAGGVPYAEASYAEVGRVINRRRSEWLAMRRDSCLATRVRHEQSDAAMDLRAACLDRRAAELDAFVGLLRAADRDLVAKAVEAAGAVGQVGTCADAAVLARRMPPPADPARRAAVSALEAELATTRALAEAGRPAAFEAAGPLVARARQLDHPPVLAEALFVLGRAAETSSRYPEAAKAYEEAVLAAEAAGDDVLRLELETQLTDVVGHHLERDQDGQAHARRGEALLARLNPGKRQEAHLTRARGQVDWWHGRYAQALIEAQRAVDLLTAASAPGDELARAYYALGVIHDDKHDDVEALAAYEQAKGFAEKALGADHPFTGRIVSSRGGSLRRLGRYDEAEQALLRGLAIQEAASGPDSVPVAGALINLGNLYASTERPEKAIECFSRSAAIFEKNAGSHSHHGLALENLGNNLSRVGRLAEAEAALLRAIEIHRSRVGPDHLATSTSVRKLGQHYLRHGQPGKAVPLLVEAARGLEASLGPDDENLARPLGFLGEAYLELGKYHEAAAAFERALATVGDDANDRQRKAEYRFALAEALIRSRSDRARALALAGEARAFFVSDPDSKAQLAQIDAWLKKHR